MTGAPRLRGPAAEQLPRSDTRIVITGASGWIGRTTLELLDNSLGPQAFARRVLAFGSNRRMIAFGQNRTIEQQALAELSKLDQSPSLVLHLAFLTKDKAAQMDSSDYLRANRAISETVLEALDGLGATAVFVASSGAAAYADKDCATAAMRLYGSLKKADEDSFAAWASERRRNAVIARIFSLSGPHINKHEHYALASFISDALAGGPIRVRADFPVYRSYVPIRELMAIVFAALLEHPPRITRFTTGGDKLEIQRVAEAVSNLLGPIPIERPPLRAEQADDYTAADVSYQQLLARYRIEHVPFEQQVVETAAFFPSGENLSAKLWCRARSGTAPSPADKRTL